MKWLRLTIASLMTVIGIISIAMIFAGVGIYSSVNIYWVILGIDIAYAILSFGTIDAGEVGMLSVLGIPVKNLKSGSGPFFAPAFISSVRREKATLFQDELPSDPENIYREEGIVPAGKFPPNRIKFGPPNPADTELKDDPYNVEMVAEVPIVVAWRIIDAIMFFTVVGTIANCRKMLQDMGVQTFGEDFAKMTPAKASQELKVRSEAMLKVLQAETTSWGICVEQAYVKPILYSHSLNKAVEGVSIANQEGKAAEERAKGQAKAVELAADAEKMRLVTTGLAKTDGEGKITELNPDANTRVWAQAIGELSELKGTLVLGREVATPIPIGQKPLGGA